jgi:hypothetical protein
MHQDTNAAPGLPLRLNVSPGEEKIPLPIIILIKMHTPSTNPSVLVRDGGNGKGLISPVILSQHITSSTNISPKILE